MLVLKENHKLYLKIKELEEYLSNNNLVLGVNEQESITIKDTESDVTVEIRDQDDGMPTFEFPHSFEYKLVIVPR